ncbi:hypothetical protein NPIL_254651 [Nephila pilipes]|uniref:Uncharacterized protein n=1 Tax=Nephila pilipes TaxID=299642 RepID=A0A8X6ISH6_NEPPI|nr:hypothetical protein NPIL_254651 [Nephila pilipes]
MDSESLLDQDMNSSASSSRASAPTHHEDFHASCKRKREIERELKTYTDFIDHCQVLIRNLERQGLINHPIYSNQCAMIQGLMKQRELLTIVVKSCNYYSLMNEVDAAALSMMSNPSPPSSAPPKNQVSVRPSQDAVAATSHADDNEMDQCWDSESEDSPMNSGPLDLNSLAVYVANQTTIDGTLEAIRALRGQETRINSVNFPSEAEKDKYQHFFRELMEEATRKYKSLHDHSLSYLNSIGLADATQSFKTVSSKKKEKRQIHSYKPRC